MHTNVLRLMSNFVKNPITEVGAYYKSRNRVNAVGDALEYFIKDLFCGSISIDDLQKKNEIYEHYFSYLGNSSTPPDIMIKGGDAIEVKKIEGPKNQLPLNSSYPKSKLYANSKMITTACRDCEQRDEKDIVYVVGSVEKNTNNLRYIWMVYGDCYAASSGIYERIADKISEGINEIPGIEFTETQELGKLNRVDPLGITYLRIRGMWGIENPCKVFGYLDDDDEGKDFFMKLLMSEVKFNSFPAKDREEILRLVEQGKLCIKDVKIKSPDNPAKLVNAKLIKFNT